MQQILLDIFIVMFLLWPVAAGVSYMRDRKRLADKMQRRRAAEGRIAPDPTRTAWRDYRRKYRQLAREEEQAVQKAADSASD